MTRRKVLIVEDRTVNLAHARAAMDRHKDKVDAVFAEDFATAEKHLRAGGIAGMLTDIFFPYAKGTGIIETNLFRGARPYCFNGDSDFAAVDLLAKTLGEEMREPLTRGGFNAEEILQMILGKNEDGTISFGSMLTLMEELDKIKPREARNEVVGTTPEWKRELDSLDTDLRSGDEARQPCGILTMRLAHEMGIPFIIVSSLHAAHGSSASPVIRLLEHEIGVMLERDTVETGGYGHRGSTEESEKQGHVKDEGVWLKALVRLLEKIGGPDSAK